MSTATAAPPRSDPPRERDETGGPAARWWAGWRVSLRMARRDIGAHRWRSALIALMVGLPVLVMVAGLTFLATNEVSLKESVPGRLGSAQALLVSRSDVQVTNWGTSSEAVVPCSDDASILVASPGWEPTDAPARCGASDVAAAPAEPVPGLSDRPTLEQARTALAGLTGGRVVPVSWVQREVLVGNRPAATTALQADMSDPATRGMATLVSGRWPSAPGEFVVTQVGARLGLPTSGQVTLAGIDAEPATVPGTIVGVADAAPLSSDRVGLISVAPTALETTNFLLDRDTPVPADEVRALNAHGLSVLSREVIENPGSLPAPPGMASGLGTGGFDSGQSLTTTAMLSLALLVVSCLLAGPAFAVIAQRQRRTLALAAANGATAAQVRRTLLAQALLLGVLATLAGMLLGLVVGAAMVPIALRLRWIDQVGPVEAPATEVGVVVGAAVLAAVVSALIPARGLTRLDVTTALRSDVVSPRPHRGLPVLGLVLWVAGAAALWALVSSPSTALAQSGLWTLGVLASGATVVVGALLLTPRLLTLLSRLGARAPLPVRLALRDAGRQRGRAIPTIAAVMAGAILLAGFGIAATSTDAFNRALYRPTAPPGQALVPVDLPRVQADRVAPAVTAALPGSRVRPIYRFGFSGQAPAPGTPVSTVAVVPSGCTPAQVVQTPGWVGPATAPVDPCAAPWASAQTSPSRMVVADPADAAALYGLDAHAEQTLAAGGAVVSDARFAPGGAMTVATGSSRWGDDPTPTWLGGGGTTQVPAVVAPLGFGVEAWPDVLVSPGFVQRFGGVPQASWAYVQGPDGPITQEQADAVAAAVGLSVFDSVQVERGYSSPIRTLLVVAFLVVALLTLIATITATALSMGEARRDLATFAAVGAPDRLRRRMAAAQAGVLALVGTVLGLAVGAVPGVYAALLTTSNLPSDITIESASRVVVPWWPILAALVLTPLLAAALAALFVRPRPDLTRRPA